jgi:RNA polymerase sigma factor (TIGR02999 family)
VGRDPNRDISRLGGAPQRSVSRWGPRTRIGMSDVTRILNAIERGEVQATDELLPLVYEELRLLAGQKLSQEKPGQTLQATALVHEAYLRLIGGESQNWSSRGHFFAAAAEAMRRILIDNARRKQCAKRGGIRRRVDLDAAELLAAEPEEDVIALDGALTRLAVHKPQVAEVVRLRYFAGLTLAQISEIMAISRRTVDSYWAYARAWLYREMTQSDETPDQADHPEG